MSQSAEDVPPSIYAERTVLGAMMVVESAFYEAEILRVGDFALDSHRSIYRAILGVAESGSAVDIVTVCDFLNKKKQVSSIGGLPYLYSLSEGLPRKLSIESYVRIVKEYSSLRRTAAVLDIGQARVRDHSEEALLIVTDIEKDLAEIRNDVHEEVTIGQQVGKMLDNLWRERSGEALRFVPSGLDEIDVTHGGYARRELTVIGARPRVGKSTILRMAVSENCQKGNHVHLFSPEMDADSILRVFAAQLSGVPFRRLRHATRLNDEDKANITAAMADVAQWPITLDDTSPLYPDVMISRARTVKRKKNTALLGLDYLQKMKYRGKTEHRHVDIGDAMVSLTAFAKNEDVAVVVVSSITEPSGKERNKAPTLADLRGSGDVQFEANTVILMHREVGENEKVVPLCSLIFAKARADADGVKEVYFNDDYIRFEGQQMFLTRMGRV